MNTRTTPLTQQDIQEARNFVAPYVEFQTYGEHPYMYHLEQVFQMAVDLGLPIEYLIASLLHDVIEDHDVTREQIADLFGEIVAALVWAVSGFGKNRREHKADTIQKLLAFPRAIKLKIIDRYCNLLNAILTGNRSKIKMYLKEMGDYKNLFEQEPELWAKLQELIVQANNYLNSND